MRYSFQIALYFFGWVSLNAATDASRPNIVHILCDDLGYGDVQCLNSQGKIRTPQLDRIASRGMTFTDAHSSSSVCTPTRYSVLTGRYNWRSKLQSHVLGGLSPRLIEASRLTVADLLKQKGYNTACIGKWHLGMGMAVKPGKTVSELNIESNEQVDSVDFTQPIKDGPNAVGFDYYYGISASLDMVPYVFLENDHPTVQPTDRLKLVMNGNNKKKLAFTREGPAAPGFKGEDVLPTITNKAVEYISAQADKPFFLYLPLNSPHTPILPSVEWQGRSGISLYADFVMQTDDCIGQVVTALEKAGVLENTLLIVTSDNGCSPQANYDQLAEHGHNPSYIFRGTKADIYDGGHRVPYLVQWPAVVKAGTRCEQTICLMDFMATVAEITSTPLPADAAEDSFSFLPQLRGELDKSVRPSLVHHSINGSFALREGKWKLIFCSDAGGFSQAKPKPNGVLAATADQLQLYDMSADIGERKNVAAQYPEVIKGMIEHIEQLIEKGRSTEGQQQKNNGSPLLWKYLQRPAVN
jgi:arylsulfatase A-like enzyme